MGWKDDVEVERVDGNLFGQFRWDIVKFWVSWIVAGIGGRFREEILGYQYLVIYWCEVEVEGGGKSDGNFSEVVMNRGEERG